MLNDCVGAAKAVDSVAQVSGSNTVGYDAAAAEHTGT